MPKKSKLEIEMTGGRTLHSLWNREPEKLRITQRCLEKLYKSKNSVRKKAYFREVENISKYFLRDSADLAELKKTHKSLKNDYAHQCQKRAALQDKLLESARKASLNDELKCRLKKERDMRLQLETDYGVLLSKYTALQNKLEN